MKNRFSNPLRLFKLILVCGPILLCSFMQSFTVAQNEGSREWADKTGAIKVKGTLISTDHKEIVLKLDEKVEGRELLAVEIASLSDTDQEFLRSAEAETHLKAAGERHSWSMRDGSTIFGKVVGFARRDITLQRRRGKLYVNDRPFENLPEVYRQMLPKVIEQFDGIPMKNKEQFNAWVLAQKGNARTFTCEGVMMEFPNGDEYGVPFFFFQELELQVLQPQWDEWLASQAPTQSSADAAQEEQRQHDLYLQSQAASYQQYQQEMLQIARMQLQMNAVAAGVTSMWEVYLYPPIGSNYYPISVVVTARNSQDASQIALMNNPGYRVGPIRRFSRY